MRFFNLDVIDEHEISTGQLLDDTIFGNRNIAKVDLTSVKNYGLRKKSTGESRTGIIKVAGVKWNVGPKHFETGQEGLAGEAVIGDR